MRLAEDLLAQAKILIQLDARRPKQANLDRAVSTSYYALFHLFIAEAVQHLCPAPKTKALMDRMSRAFQHGEMKTVCRQFEQKVAPDILATLIPNGTSPHLREIASIFVNLQEERHAADYDVGTRFSREHALAAWTTAERAFELWGALQRSEANVFLTALAFGARWYK